jgi:ABC-type multidrug transport system fused ATPase/permease subunit
MFIVWGTKQTERYLGRVAEYCPICDDACACRLYEVRMVSHLYYIPFGRGQVNGHLLWCEQCNEKFGTDPHRYTETSRDLRASIEDLTDVTHPQLIERMAERLDQRENVALGESDEQQRHAVLCQPFVAILAPVTKRCSETNIDLQSVAWFLAMIIAPLTIFIVSALINSRWMPVELVVGLVLVSILVTGVFMILSIARDGKRFIRKRYWSHLIKFLAPLDPTAEELREVIHDLKNHPPTVVVGKRIDPDELHRDIQAFKDEASIETVSPD